MMDDHGQILTYFENIFGGEIEHEVIKIVLQSCKWNTEEAIEKLFSMQSATNELRPNASNISPIIHNSDHEFPKLLGGKKTSSFSQKNLYLDENSKNVAHISVERPIQNSKNYANNNIIKIEHIKNLLKENKVNILIIMRGLPGSGKSTLAKELRGSEGIVLSTDDFFYDSVGNYNFKREALSEAHDWNKNRAKINLKTGKSPTIIDNTNLQLWEFEAYIHFALEYGYLIELLEPETAWKYNIKELARRNSHNVPSKKIDEMYQKFQRNLTIEDILSEIRKKKEAKKKVDHINVSKCDVNVSSEPSSSLRIFVTKGSAPYQLEINELRSYNEPDVVIESSDSDDGDAKKNLANSTDCYITNKVEKNTELFGNEPIRECVIKDLLNLNLHENNGVLVCEEDENLHSETKTNNISKEHFSDMVNTFSSAVKNAVKKENIVHSENNEDYKDDHDMYQILSLHEDKVKDAFISMPSANKPISECSDPVAVNVDILYESNLASLTDERRNDVARKLSPTDVSNWHSVFSKCAAEVWNTEEEDPPNIISNARSRRRDLVRKGDPCKWLNNEDDKNVKESDKKISEWDFDLSKMQSWEDENDFCLEKNSPLSYTGAVPKQARSEQVISLKPISYKLSDNKIENYSQVSATDFMLLQNTSVSDKNTKILFGNVSRFVAGNPAIIHRNEPLTKCKLLLDKSSTTEDLSERALPHSEALSRIKSLFPNICKSDLQDVLEKCKYDIDWAVNILIDGEYEISDIVKDQDDLSSSESESKENSVSESLENTVNVSPVAANDSEVRHKRIKQCTDSEMIDLKNSIENNFVSSLSLDDKTRRLTGKDYSKINSRSSNNAAEKNFLLNPEFHSASFDGRDSISPENGSEGDSGEGAQYLTLEIDSLFASQLVNIFGSVSTFQMNSNFAKEDYKVILPLEICHQIHKSWSATLDGNFQNETEILDRFIRDDEELARKLQEEEDADSEMEIVQSSDIFQKDPPHFFQEIVDIEKAIEISTIKKVNSNTTYSSVVILKKLQTEFGHVDRLAVERILSENEFNYERTKDVLAFQYGINLDENRETSGNWTEREAHGVSNEKTDEDSEMCEEEYLALNNPQIYRDEAQMYNELRKSAFQKAQEASQNNLKAVASYYAQVGNAHAIKFKEANERASKMILNAFNSKNKDANTLDLHLLHVPEAIQATQSFLSERKSILVNRKLNQLHVFIITGRGKHSANNEPRLKPAIKFFLQKEGYSCHEEHAGMLKVTIR